MNLIVTGPLVAFNPLGLSTELNQMVLFPGMAVPLKLEEIALLLVTVTVKVHVPGLPQPPVGGAVTVTVVEPTG